MAENDLPDWLERIDCIRARVELTENDSVTILALPLEEVADLEKAARALTEPDEEPGEQEAQDALAGQMPLIDRVLTRAIESWELPDLADAYGLGNLPESPSFLDPEERDALYRRLPASVLFRIADAVQLHSGNS